MVPAGNAISVVLGLTFGRLLKWRLGLPELAAYGVTLLTCPGNGTWRLSALVDGLRSMCLIVRLKSQLKMLILNTLRLMVVLLRLIVMDRV